VAEVIIARPFHIPGAGQDGELLDSGAL